MTVVVTGSLGFIGSAVAVALRDAGHEVTGIDNGVGGRVDAIPGVDHRAIDITDRSALAPVIEAADAVVHLAAVPGVANCAADPVLATRVNVVATADIATACAEHGVGLVFGSTIGVYGDVERIDGTQPRTAEHYYGRTKRAGEDVIDAVADGHLPAIVFQMGNLYGSHTVDGRPVTKATAVNFFVERAASGRPLTVHEPGTQTRDFVHIADVARAYRLAVERLDDLDTGSRTLPLASGERYTVESVAERVGRGTGAPVEYVPHPGDPVWVPPIDVGATKRLLDWEPRHAVLDYVDRQLAVVTP